MPESPRGDQPKRAASQLPGIKQYAGMGLELGASVAGMTLAGWWIDSKLGTEPVWLVTGAVLGATGGMYNLIRQALAISPKQQEPKQKQRKDHEGDVQE